MSWASRRQLKYFSIFVIFIAGIIFLIISPVLFRDPTCFDGKKNGDETGKDCGGSCYLMCKESISDPVILWSRGFKVLENNYNLVAYVENRNKNSGVAIASYEFKIYDINNKLIGTRAGKTFIPPNQQFAVFEPRFNSGQNQIKTVTFEFLEPLVWVKKYPTLQTIKFGVSNIIFDNNIDNPTLTALVYNDDIYDLPEFDVIAILYDIEHNAINVSKTRKDKLSSDERLPVVFTWPEPLSSVPVIKEVFVSIDPFSVPF
jgi:hypothetical protein